MTNEPIAFASLRTTTAAAPVAPCASGQRAHAAAAQAGMTLVELMVSIALGLLILTALVTMFASTSAARGEIDKASRQIENGRFALESLAAEVRHAGYFGKLVNMPAIPAAMPDPCSTVTANVRDAIGIPLQGYAGEATAALMTAQLSFLDAAAGYKPGTAVLVVRRAGTGTLGVAPIAGVFNIQVSGCAGDASRYIVDVAAGTFNLHANGAPGCTPLTSAPAAEIAPLMVRIYYVSTCSNGDCTAASADSVPTLKRIDVTPTSVAPTPIVDGIENLQLDYGMDTSVPADGTPDVYTNTAAHPGTVPANLAEWRNVMTARLYLLARNVDRSNGFTDSKTYSLGPVSFTPSGADAPFKRHAYNEIVRLNNPAGRRE